MIADFYPQDLWMTVCAAVDNASFVSCFIDRIAMCLNFVQELQE